MCKYIFVLFCFFVSHTLNCQTSKSDILAGNTKEKEKRVDFSLMPYLSYNRNLKLMFGLVPMMMYKINPKDSISPKSLTGIAAITSTNGSYALAFFNKFYFKEDKWRASLYAFTGDLSSQFYVDNLFNPRFYDYTTDVQSVGLKLQRKVFNGLYVGLGYHYSKYKTVYEDTIQPEATTETNGIETSIQYDRRNSVYYPTTGKLSILKWVAFPTWFGNSVNANKIETEYNQYIPLRNNKDVLATRFSGTFGLGDIAFEQQISVGGKDIRGYSQGKYRGDGLLTIQAEYRYNFFKRMGVVGFLGAATVYGSETKNFNGLILPGAGIGFRYQAFEKIKFNIGIDAAFGRDDWSVNFRIGECF